MQAIMKKLSGETFFFSILLVVFLIRISLSIWLPMTGDEAYFIVWGKNLDYGYYDHTPFVGWLLAALLSVSDAAWWLRLPSVLLPVVLSYFIFRILQPRHAESAVWVALVYLVAPVNVINVLITTDTPLIFFSFISAWFFYKALYEKEELKYFLICGLFLGLAFFSKYFAVFLGITYGIYILIYHRNRSGLIGLGIILLMVLPFVLINLLWNYNNCWNNILFNLFNRTAGADDSFMSLIKYLIMLTYLFSPVLIYFLIKNNKLFNGITSNKFNRVYLWLIIIPLSLFLILLIRKEVGLHWVFSFYPFAFIAFAGILSEKQWRWTFHFMWFFSALHFLLIGLILLANPISVEKTYHKFFNPDKKEISQNLTFAKYPEEVLAHLEPYEKDYTFATISYGMSSVASYYSRRDFIVFDKASFHAREDEKLTNYKELNGKNILIFKRTGSNLDKLERYFMKSRRQSFTVREATFELLIGEKFNYMLYRDEILKEINHDYYAIPAWLPSSQCGFKSKYGFL